MACSGTALAFSSHVDICGGINSGTIHVFSAASPQALRSYSVASCNPVAGESAAVCYNQYRQLRGVRQRFSDS
jgi:hypothetical protein